MRQWCCVVTHNRYLCLFYMYVQFKWSLNATALTPVLLNRKSLFRVKVKCQVSSKLNFFVSTHAMKQ